MKTPTSEELAIIRELVGLPKLPQKIKVTIPTYPYFEFIDDVEKYEFVGIPHFYNSRSSVKHRVSFPETYQVKTMSPIAHTHDVILEKHHFAYQKRDDRFGVEDVIQRDTYFWVCYENRVLYWSMT
jgi:hypothetical protein